MISLFNDWFDLFNTQHKYDKGVASYGLDETNQNIIIEKMNNFIKHLRVHEKKSLLPFQKGKLFLLFIPDKCVFLKLYSIKNISKRYSS